MIRFHADSYFHIGGAHVTAGKPCQDYAASAYSPDDASIVVSDGCSTGGHTDIGSRIVSLATMKAIQQQRKLEGQGWYPLSPERIAVGRGLAVDQAQSTLGISRSDLLATCIYAAVNQTGGFFHVEGDGAFALKMRDGLVRMIRFEWMDNTPFYPAYSEADRRQFQEVHGGDPEAPRFTATEKVRMGNKTISADLRYSLAEGMNGATIRLLVEDLSGVQLIAVFSDGVTQIENVPWDEAVLELLAMKSLAGDFAKRRMIRGIKDFRERGKGPLDDIAYAVIAVEEGA